MADKLLMLTYRGVAENAFIEDNARELKAWLEEEMERSWLWCLMLMIVRRGGRCFDILRYIPVAGRVSVLITSRVSQLDIGQGVAVGKLLVDDAVTLLAKRASVDLTLLDSNPEDYPVTILPSIAHLAIHF
ncbi:hypothetical protein BDW75DRAFT_245728 [Aspergillus navahoensis]